MSNNTGNFQNAGMNYNQDLDQNNQKSHRIINHMDLMNKNSQSQNTLLSKKSTNGATSAYVSQAKFDAESLNRQIDQHSRDKSVTSDEKFFGGAGFFNPHQEHNSNSSSPPQPSSEFKAKGGLKKLRSKKS